MSEGSMFDQPWDDAPEEKLPPQALHDLVIQGYEVMQTKEKTGDDGMPKPTRQMLRVQLKIESPIDYQTIFHYITFPNANEWKRNGGDDDSERTAKMMIRGARRFLRVFKLSEADLQGNLDHLEGARGRCLVTHRKGDNGEPIPQLQLPRAED